MFWFCGLFGVNLCNFCLDVGKFGFIGGMYILVLCEI